MALETARMGQVGTGTYESNLDLEMSVEHRGPERAPSSAHVESSKLVRMA